MEEDPPAGYEPERHGFALLWKGPRQRVYNIRNNDPHRRQQVPGRKAPKQTCASCYCTVDPRWHWPEVCRRYMKITSLARAGFTFADIGQRVGVTRQRVREIVQLFDVPRWLASKPTEQARKYAKKGAWHQVAMVLAEAKRRGLPAEVVRVTPGGQRKWLLVGGQKCQIVTARVIHTHPKYIHRPYVRIYRPRQEWAEFLVYVIEDAADYRESYFLVIPREKVRKNTTLLGGESVLRQYTNAWHLLSGQAQKLRNLPDIAKPIGKVFREAERRGLLVQRVRPRTQGKEFYSRRLMIQGRRCEVKRAYTKQGSCVHLQPSRDEWPDFLVYVCAGPGKRRTPFLIIPKGFVAKQMFRSWDKPPLDEYADAWHLLASTACDSPENSQSRRP